MYIVSGIQPREAADSHSYVRTCAFTKLTHGASSLAASVLGLVIVLALNLT